MHIFFSHLLQQIHFLKYFFIVNAYFILLGRNIKQIIYFNPLVGND